MATLTQDAPLGDETSASHWRQRVDRAFSRAAPRYRQLARAQLAMAQSLLDDLPPRHAQARQNTVNDHEPVQNVLDLGCGPGDLTWQMCDRYPNAQVIGLDLSLAMLAEARRHAARPDDSRPCSASASSPVWLKADAQSLPLATASIDLLVSNLAIQWCPDLAQVLANVHRVLRPGGRAVINTLLPGTLHEVASAWQRPGHSSGVLVFPSLAQHQQWVDQSPWQDAVLRPREVTFHYPDIHAVMASIKGVGAQVARPGAGLTRRELAQAKQRYERLRTPQGLPVTYHQLTLVLTR
ncbi:methyltransferase domain-containing protein [Halomonas sp. DP8Y7-3]|uniref:methyltransferase domain-containing protein n=1 Tax=Halomonas sp. DP8Y7-3 TaxID=2859079 RepID=UPI001C96CDF3|nr:methyltransferase domain-containing protein [Halomonas sp. DP8Y7-3]MBY5931149.1 methyltransferase domain-containing protein [Halomonas sp. DP8Y7-3]